MFFKPEEFVHTLLSCHQAAAEHAGRKSVLPRDVFVIRSLVDRLPASARGVLAEDLQPCERRMITACTRRSKSKGPEKETKARGRQGRFGGAKFLMNFSGPSAFYVERAPFQMRQA